MLLHGVSTKTMKDGFHHRYWVYIVASATGTLYTSLTGDLHKRIMQHKIGEIEGFSKQYNCTRLVYYEGFDQTEKMIQREKQIKSWRREKKNCADRKDESATAGSAESWGRPPLLPGESINKEIP